MITLYNTLTKKKEEFKPLRSGRVGMYNCGPTVYDFAHIGNLRSFVFADILRRTLEYNGYEVNQVMNITDVGHLVSDGDDGEDKMTKGLKREGKEISLAGMKELANFYADRFEEDIEKLNIKKPKKLPKASEHIDEQIEILKRLDDKEFLYKTSDGVYFDIKKDPEYGKLGGVKEMIYSGYDTESRIEENSEKRNPRDFAVWKFNPTLGWDSPWGKGFPGWHIECSAMSMKYLGETFDIHTGGIDHIQVHHNNEIAQSENATGKPFAHYWMHNAFINIGGDKIAKSAGNTFHVKDFEERGINPLAYRYFVLQAHYRSQMNFSWDALMAAETALERLYAQYEKINNDTNFFQKLFSQILIKPHKIYKEKFKEAINNDLDTPKALALVWELIKDQNIPPEVRCITLLDFDRVLGLSIKQNTKIDIPYEVQQLIAERDEARKNKDWKKADELRSHIEARGFTVKDTKDGQQIS